MRRVLCLILLAACLTICQTVFAQSLTVQQYSDALSKVQVDAQAVASGKEPTGVYAISAIQPIVRCTVRTQSNDLVFVDNRPIESAMLQAEQERDKEPYFADWTDIVAQIAAVKAALGTSTQTQSPQAIKATAISVLSRSDFASTPIPGKTVWEKIGDWLSNEWDKFMKSLHLRDPSATPGKISPAIPEVILTIIIVLAVGLAIYYIALWIRNASDERAKVRPESGIALTFEEKELVASHNYERLRQLAQEAADRGEYRPAFRLMFLATLVLLDFEGIIRLDRSKTNWEYLRSVSGDSALLSALQPFVRDFDRIWYGDRPADDGSFRAALDSYDLIRRIVEERVSRAQSTTPQSRRLVGSAR